MKIARQPLIQALNIAGLVLERRMAIPILGYLAIKPEGGAIEVSGTDLDMEVRVEIEGIDTSGEAITIPEPARIARVLNLGGETVEIVRVPEGKDKAHASIRSGRLDLQVSDLPFEDYPRLPSSGLLASDARLSTAHLDTILRVAHACSTEETRYYLNGVYLHAAADPSTVDATSLRAVATDGHRLYYAPLAIPGASDLAGTMPVNGDQRGILIPRKALRLLRQLRKRIDGEIRFGIQPSASQSNDNKTLAPAPAGTLARFSFTTKDRRCKVTLSTKIIDGTFPDYERVIPTADQDKQVEIDRRALRSAVSLISDTSSGKTKAIKLTFDPADGGRLRVSAKHADAIMSAATWIAANTSVKVPFEIGFNGRYLADICDVSAGDNLVIETTAESAPSLIASPTDDGFRTVLMPMRV